MSVQDDLKSVKDLLILPKSWTKGAFFSDRFGKVTERGSSATVKYDVLGAIMEVSEGRATSARQDRYDAMVEAIEPHIETSISTWNDAPETTHADILEVLNHAIDFQA